MTAFIAAATALTLGVLAFLLRPLYLPRLAQGGFTQNRRTLAVVALALPLAAAALYALIGNPSALDPASAAASADPQVEKMVASLAEKLERDPSDTKGWVMLARSYKVMGRMREAEAAYDKASDAIAGDAQELANYADVAASNAGGRFAGKPALLIEKALRANPQNTMAMWLAGAAALDAGDTKGGIAVWQKLLAQLPPESDDARELRGQIAQAGGTVAEPPVQPQASGRAVSGRVEIAAGLAASPDDVVFIIARAPGQRIPSAVLRTTVSQLPKQFTLDDSLAMSPDLRISALRDVEVEARVSKSGEPIAKPGDLVSDVQKAEVGANGIVLKISRTKAAS